MDYIVTLFSAILNWLTQLFTATNTINLFIACFSICVVYRFLVKPILGGRSIGGSDKARVRHTKGSDSNE